jgi:hypothetical protein
MGVVAQIDLEPLDDPQRFHIDGPNGERIGVTVNAMHLYVRKDEVAEQIGGIIIPDNAGITREVEGSDLGDIQAKWSPRENADTCVIMGIGNKVKYSRIRGPFRVGQILLIPRGDHDGIWLSPYCSCDRIIDIEKLDRRVDVSVIEHDA